MLTLTLAPAVLPVPVYTDVGFTIICPGGEKIRVMLVRVKGSYTTPGIDAPRDCLVFREELVAGVQRPGRNRRRPTRGVPFRVAATWPEVKKEQPAECLLPPIPSPAAKAINPTPSARSPRWCAG